MGKFLNKKLLLFLVANRIILFLVIFVLVTIHVPADTSKFKSFSDFFLTFGKRWDGNSYTFIASHGYVLTGPEKNFIVFPPFYPFLIKSLAILGINYVLSGMIISNVFFIFAMLVFYKLLRLDYGADFSFLVILLISIFPTSFFFSVAYPESLFVLLFVLAFYFSRKKIYLYAGIFAGLAAVTRPFGAVLFPALIFQLIENKDLNLKNLISISVPFAIPPLYYLLINFILFGNPFTFLIFLKTNWYKSFDFPWNGILASWKRGIGQSDSFTYKYFVGFGEAVASTLAWISVFFGIKKWGMKSSYLLYLTLGTLFFTSTSFILSAPRYLLSIPPFFILFAEIFKRNKFLLYGWAIVSIFLLFYISYEFSWGHWTF